MISLGIKHIEIFSVIISLPIHQILLFLQLFSLPSSQNIGRQFMKEMRSFSIYSKLNFHCNLN